MNQGIENIKATQSIPVAVHSTSPVNGAAVDCRGYEEAGIIFACGVVDGTTPTADAKIQSSADGSSGWADVTGAVFVQRTDSNDEVTLSGKVIVSSSRPYLRGVLTLGGGTPSCAGAVIIAPQGARGGTGAALAFSVNA